MTNEQAKIVADYMGWLTHPMGSWYDAPVYFAAGKAGNINFDLNDAGLVVAEMRKRGEWVYFYDDLLDTYNGLCEDGKVSCGAENFTAWIFNADNFFKAFCEWRKGK
jgi:hypothetical protein